MHVTRSALCCTRRKLWIWRVQLKALHLFSFSLLFDLIYTEIKLLINLSLFFNYLETLYLFKQP